MTCYTSENGPVSVLSVLLQHRDPLQRGSLLRSVLYLGQLHAERRDLDLPQPPQGLQSERRGAAGQELDERQEVEVIITDEELQQDVQGAGENAVRHGHGYPQQPALEHVHGASTGRSAQSPIGGLCPLQSGFGEDWTREGLVLRETAAHCCRTDEREQRKDVRL